MGWTRWEVSRVGVCHVEVSEDVVASRHLVTLACVSAVAIDAYLCSPGPSTVSVRLPHPFLYLLSTWRGAIVIARVWEGDVGFCLSRSCSPI